VEGESMVVGKIMKYAPSRFLASSSSFKLTQEKDIERVETYPLTKSLLLEEKGKTKGRPSVMEHLQQAFRRLVHPDTRRFYATFPIHSCEEGVCHKDSSSSCLKGISNPITHITRILLATERLRRRKKREKQKVAPYKIYYLHHS
jgi:hypothetical protein